MTLLPFYGPSLHCTHGRSLRAALALEVPKGSANEHEQWVRIREEGKAARAFAASGAATMQAAAASSTSSAENAASGADATQAAETETTAETQATSAESATTQAVVDKHDDDSDAAMAQQVADSVGTAQPAAQTEVAAAATTSPTA